MISWWRTEFGAEETERVADAIANERISQGVVTEAFEKAIGEAIDVPYVAATTSGSVAILMALMAHGIGHGDEVIVPNRTWIATAHAPALLGAQVVLVDVLPDRPIMDVSRIEEKITSRTKAIIPVHLGGRAVDMASVNEMAERYGLIVIEDAAQGLFVKNEKGFLGTQSGAGCFSLSVAKLISTGQGGFVVTSNADTYEQLKLVRGHGTKDVVHVDYMRMGFNFRFTDILASVGLAQLEKASSRVEHVLRVHERYRQGLERHPEFKLIPVDVAAGEIPLYVEILSESREDLIAFLAHREIQTRPFYPDLDRAEHLQAVGEYPNSRVFGEQGLILPCGPTQSLENVDFVLGALDSFVSGQKS